MKHEGAQLSEAYWQKQMAAPPSLRSAERHAGFLLPYLAPGMRLLDVGCGPGSITRDLARRVAPAVCIGLDASRSRLGEARSVQASNGGTDLSAPAGPHFVLGDAYALPFADGAFDAAYCHALVQHLAAPLDAMRELHRVLRPDAVVGVADWDIEATIVYPPSPPLTDSLALFSQLRRRSGGSPDAARRLGELLSSAGFDGIEMAVQADGLASKAASRATAEQWASGFENEATAVRMIAEQLCDRETLARFSAAWRRWGAQPGAIWVTHWFFAVARR